MFGGPRRLRFLLPVLVLAAGVGVFAYLVGTKPELAPSAARERVWPVAATTVEVATLQPDLLLYGEIVAGREVEMRALVSGQVVEVGPGFVDGGVVRKGDLLVAIDPFDYRAALDERRAQLAEAKARLVEIEARRASESEALERDKEMVRLRERELDRVKKLKARGAVSDKALDQAKLELSRQRQAVSTRRNMVAAETARLDQQRAAIARLEVGIRRAERDLANTRLTAPFDGFVLEPAAEVGQRLGVNGKVARLIDAGRLEAAIHLSDAQYGRLMDAEGGLRGRPARVLWRTGDRTLTFDAVIDRVGARIAAATGGIDAYAVIADAGIDGPLRPGAFVEVRTADRAYENVARLPESAVHDDATVYVIEDGRLSPRAVTVAARDGEDVLVRGELESGERVVTTRFAEIGPGVRVEVR